MCNRYQQAEIQEAMDALNAILEDSFNVAASTIHPAAPELVIRHVQGQRVIKQKNWGFPLVTRKMKDNAAKKGKEPKPKPVNNCRSDKLDSYFWKKWTDPEYRCIIPVKRWAEAQGPKGRMTETWISVPEISTMAVAGLWRPSDVWGDCYTMMMCDSSKDIAHIHHRMPVILDDKHINDWLTVSNDQIVDICRTWSGAIHVNQTPKLWAISNRNEPQLF